MLERPAPDGPFGGKGPGEMCANPVLPAVANAIFNAVGVRIDDLPITPEKVLRALKRPGRRAAAGPALRPPWRLASRSSGSTGRRRSSTRCARAFYLADEGLATAAYLALALGKPLLLEGAPGVGKTEAAKAIAGRARPRASSGCNATRASTPRPRSTNGTTRARCWRSARPASQPVDIYRDEFLIERPMLEALRTPDEAVLLIDEIDRSDHEFEAFLLEFLSDFQISIPERGTLRAHERPVVILTSNRTRELHEALRRRCVYHWIDYPDPEREARIIMMRASIVAESTARAVVAAVGRLRREPLTKPPGVAEAVDWAEAATLLHQRGARWPDAFRRAIGVALKDEEDLAYMSGAARRHPGGGGGMSLLDLPRAARPFVDASRRCCAPTASRSRPSRPRRSSQAVGLLGPRSIADIRRAAHATLAPPPERRAEFDALFDCALPRRDCAGDGEALGEPDDETSRVQDERAAAPSRCSPTR